MAFRSPFDEPCDNPKKNPSDVDCKLMMMRQGYSDACRVLEFRIGYINKEQIKPFVDIIGKYNAFEPARVKKAIDMVSSIVDFYEIGREGSPVMYIRWKDWSDNREANKAALETAFVKLAKADEFSEVEGGRFIRVWWD